MDFSGKSGDLPHKITTNTNKDLMELGAEGCNLRCFEAQELGKSKIN